MSLFMMNCMVRNQVKPQKLIFLRIHLLQLMPMVEPTRLIIGFENITYRWHSFVSQGACVSLSLNSTTISSSF